MMCPDCGAKTKVRNTHPNGAVGGRVDGHMHQKVWRVVGWYTRDWVARYRRCSACDWRGFTVELLVEDLKVGWDARH